MPTEELFGAYNFLLESADKRSQFSSRLRQLDIRISEKGFDQALKGDPVDSAADRGQLAKLLKLVAGDGGAGLKK